MLSDKGEEIEPLLVVPQRQNNNQGVDNNQLNGQSKSVRWIVLFFASVLLFGNYYCYDIPGAINEELGKHMALPYEQWQIKMNALYTAYSIPNLIMPLIGGILIDILGSNRMLISFAILATFGQVLFAFGVYSRTFWIMAVGRAVFGVGGESLEVAQARITTDWFAGSFLGLALGLNLTSARISTALNDFISPRVWNGPVGACIFGIGACLISLLSAVALHIFYKRHFVPSSSNDAINYDNDDDGKHINGSVVSIDVVDTESYSSIETRKLLHSTRSSKSSPSTRPNSVLSSDSASSSTSDSSSIKHGKYRDESSNDEYFSDHKFNLRSCLKLPKSFWILCLGAMSLYGAVNPFIHILSDLLEKRHQIDAQTAAAYMSIPDLVSAVGSPAGGLLLDTLCRRSRRYQRMRSLLIPVAGVVLLAVHYCIGFTQMPPALPLVGLGISYSIFGAALWPLIPQFVCDKSILGTAYGISTVALNISLSAGPVIVGQLLVHGGYPLVQTYFMALSGVCIAIGCLVVISDGNQPNNSRFESNVI